MPTPILIAAIAGLLTVAGAHAQEAGITVTLEAAEQAEILRISYDCGQDESIEATYINAAPNILAFIPVNGDTVLFTSAISASGARYTAGRYEWWTKGREATLRDLMAEENADPILTCSEADR